MPGKLTYSSLEGKCAMTKPAGSLPLIAQKAPFPTEVQAGRSYWWCACGMSKKQPFCDGSHKGSDFSPVEYKADAARAVYFCGCKQSKNGALCDGSHKTL